MKALNESLMMALLKSDVESVLRAIKKGADVNSINLIGTLVKYPLTPLVQAVFRDNIECVKILLAAKAKPDGLLSSSSAGALADDALVDAGLADAARKARKEYDDLISVLLQDKADANGVTSDEVHASLFYSARYGRGSHGVHAPLFYAARYGHAKCMQLLLAAGADVNRVKGGVNGLLKDVFEEGEKNLLSLILDDEITQHTVQPYHGRKACATVLIIDRGANIGVLSQDRRHDIQTFMSRPSARAMLDTTLIGKVSFLQEKKSPLSALSRDKFEVFSRLICLSKTMYQSLQGDQHCFLTAAWGLVFRWMQVEPSIILAYHRAQLSDPTRRQRHMQYLKALQSTRDASSFLPQKQCEKYMQRLVRGGNVKGLVLFSVLAASVWCIGGASVPQADLDAWYDRSPTVISAVVVLALWAGYKVIAPHLSRTTAVTSPRLLSNTVSNAPAPFRL